MSTDDTCMGGVENRPTEAEPPTHPYTFVDAAFYIKLKATLEVIYFSVWAVFIQQYQFNELDNCMSKLKKGQNVNKSAEETPVELDSEMSMNAELIGNLITQQVTSAMAKRKENSMKRKFKNWRKVERMECQESWQKT